METLTARDVDPGEGTAVRDACGRRWDRDDDEYLPAAWTSESGDRQSWTKVAGNYGPVTVLERA